MFKQKTIAELKKELEKEKGKALARQERKGIEDEILKWKTTAKSQNTDVKERIKKAANFLGKEITFYGTNVRENIDKQHTKKGRRSKKSSGDGWDLV